jgi:osmotically-inducible protein OsmY
MAAPAAAAQADKASDDAITAKVKAQIDADPELKGLDIAVTTAQNVVTLKGEVPSALMRAKAGELVKKAAGGSKINNKLTLAKAKK